MFALFSSVLARVVLTMGEMPSLEIAIRIKIDN